jgi:hypothetical protein
MRRLLLLQITRNTRDDGAIEEQIMEAIFARRAGGGGALHIGF